MSTDERVARQIVKTLENGKQGFELAAERLEANGDVAVAADFRRFAAERATMAREIESIAGAYGDDVDERSTVPGALHRGWMMVKDAFTGKDSKAVIDTAEQGEDHALEVYREAIAADISEDFRGMLQRQMTSVQRAHDEVRRQKSLQHAQS